MAISSQPSSIMARTSRTRTVARTDASAAHEGVFPAGFQIVGNDLRKKRSEKKAVTEKTIHVDCPAVDDDAREIVGKGRPQADVQRDHPRLSECRVQGKQDCEARFPGPDLEAARNACITDAYIACGERPTLRVDPRTLEQLADLLRPPRP